MFGYTEFNPPALSKSSKRKPTWCVCGRVACNKCYFYSVVSFILSQDRVDSLQWAHCGLKFVSGSKDGTAKIWKFEREEWKERLLSVSVAGVESSKSAWKCFYGHRFIMGVSGRRTD